MEEDINYNSLKVAKCGVAGIVAGVMGCGIAMFEPFDMDTKFLIGKISISTFACSFALTALAVNSAFNKDIQKCRDGR